MFGGAVTAGLAPSPARCGSEPHLLVPVVAVRAMLHAAMASVTVRVVPRAGVTSVAPGPQGVVVRVRSAPQGGRATEEARRALAAALGVAPWRITLRTGARARTKVFDVDGLSRDDVAMRLRATLGD